MDKSTNGVSVVRTTIYPGSVMQTARKGPFTSGTSGTLVKKAALGSTIVDLNTGLVWTNIGSQASPYWIMADGVQKFTLSAAQILGMFAAPVTLVANPGAGLCITVNWVQFSFQFKTTPYANGGNVNFNYVGGSSAHSGAIAASVLTGNTSQVIGLGPQTGATGVVIPVNAGIQITNATAAFITGDSTAVININYSIVPNN